MTPWLLAIAFLFLSLTLLAPDIEALFSFFIGAGNGLSGRGFVRARMELESVQRELRRFEDRLGSGTLPGDAQWVALARLPSPWGGLIHDTVSELRAAGCRILPTLKRLRELAAHQLSALLDGRARSTQALAQAGVCAAMVPLMSVTLYFLVPGVSAHPWLWMMVGLAGLFWAGIGAAWMAHLADQARWGGLRASERAWALWAPATIERLIACTESGVPPDLAWAQALGFLNQSQDPGALELGELWRVRGPDRFAPSAADAVRRLGDESYRAVQAALLEGCGCRERIESALAAYRDDFRSAIERELSLLSTRSLKPLFVCVAPAAMVQLAIALVIAALATESIQ